MLVEPSSRPPPCPHTYQVPEQENHDAHHQRAQPEEPQAPVALPAETTRIRPLCEAQSCPSPKFGTPPAPPSPGKVPRGSGTPSPPRSPLAHGCDHGEVEPVVDEAVPVTDHDAVRRAQVRLALPRGETSQNFGFFPHFPGDLAALGALQLQGFGEPELRPCARSRSPRAPRGRTRRYLPHVDLCEARNEAILLQGDDQVDGRGEGERHEHCGRTAGGGSARSPPLPTAWVTGAGRPPQGLTAEQGVLEVAPCS